MTFPCSTWSSRPDEGHRDPERGSGVGIRRRFRMRDRVLGAVSLRRDTASQPSRQRRRRRVQVQELRELPSAPELIPTALQHSHRHRERDESVERSPQYFGV